MKSTPIKKTTKMAAGENDTLSIVSAHLRAFYKERIGMFLPGANMYGNFRIVGLGVPAKDGWYMDPNGAARVQRSDINKTNDVGQLRILLERIYDGKSQES